MPFEKLIVGHWYHNGVGLPRRICVVTKREVHYRAASDDISGKTQICRTTTFRVWAKEDAGTDKEANSSGVREIELGNNKVAIVDSADYDKVSRLRWHAAKQGNTWYAYTHVRDTDGKKWYLAMHRYILGLVKGDPVQVDHFNHDGLDNRRENIRPVTRAQNQHNWANAKGYRWNADTRKFTAHIGINGNSIYLGGFGTAAEARTAYVRAKQLYHPESELAVKGDVHE